MTDTYASSMAEMGRALGRLSALMSATPRADEEDFCGARPCRTAACGSPTILDEETTTGAVGGSPVCQASHRAAEMPIAPNPFRSTRNTDTEFNEEPETDGAREEKDNGSTS